MPVMNDRELIIEHNEQVLADFKKSIQTEVSLPVAPSVLNAYLNPHKISRRTRTYTKKSISKDYAAVQFVRRKENNESRSEGFVLHITADELRKLVRWGVYPAQSVSGKAIAELGRWRLSAYGRITKGMISNTHVVKERLLDLYQDRFELLGQIELLTNLPLKSQEQKKEAKAKFINTFHQYIQRLTKIKTGLYDRFQDTDLEKINNTALIDLEKDIQKDIDAATHYLQTHFLKHATSQVKAEHVSASHPLSAAEFVKQNLLDIIDEAEGINHDISFSRKRRFALTRGVFGGCCIDARKTVRYHNPDMSNQILNEHHGLYNEDVTKLNSQLVSVDYTKSNQTTDELNNALLAISFIKKYDQVVIDKNGFRIKSQEGERKLKVIYATNWRMVRSVSDFFRKAFDVLKKMVQGIIYATRPISGNALGQGRELVVDRFLKRSRPKAPFWRAPYQLFKSIGHSVVDFLKGITVSVMNDVFIKMPTLLIKDWHATNILKVVGKDGKQKPISLVEGLQRAEAAIEKIKTHETKRIQFILGHLPVNQHDMTTPRSNSAYARRSAEPPYELKSPEANGLLESLGRGANQFADAFAHNIFAKDPMAGLVFMSTYTVAGLAIAAPQLLKVLGPYLDVSKWLGDLLGTSVTMSAGSNALLQAQITSSFLNMLVHGPESWLGQAGAEFTKQPHLIFLAVGGAYATGYLLANGIGGYTIPGLSEFLKEDLGKNPDLSYPLIGLKVFLLIFEAFESAKKDEFKQIASMEAIRQIERALQNKTAHLRYYFGIWLAQNGAHLKKLDKVNLLMLEQFIDKYFSHSEALSLKRLLYPERPHSIAQQLVLIPVGYISAILQLVASVGLSVGAALMGRDYPMIPIKNAAIAFWDKLAKDLSRLLVFQTEVARFIYKVVATPIVLIADVLTLTLTRIAGLFGVPIAHDIYKGFSTIRRGVNVVSGVFDYGAIMKAVGVAEPFDTIKKIEIPDELSPIKLKALPRRQPSSVIHSREHSSSTGSTPRAQRVLSF